MPMIYRHHHVVRDDEIDDQGHANNVAFVQWMQDAAIAHSTAQGWDPGRYVDTGTAWVVRTHFIRYLQAAFAGEELEVRTWVVNFRKVTSLRRYRMFRNSDQTLLAEAETDWAYVSRERGTPQRIPPELSGAFELFAGD